MSHGLYGMPGLDSIRQTVENHLIWGGDRNQVGVIQSPGKTYSSTLVDGGSSPTSDIRAGLLLGEISSSGELAAWDADNTDGTQDLYGVVPVSFSTLDPDGTAVDKFAPSPIIRAPLVASSLLIQGTALTSHVDEFLARRALWGMGCILDDDPQGYKAGATQRIARVTGTTDTLTEAENGSKIFYSNAASVTVTLPTIHAGLWYDLVREGDEEFVITSAEGDNVIAGNDLSADSLTFTTAGEHIGAWVRVTGVYVSTTLKWHMQIMGVPLGVGLDAWTYAIAT